MEFIKVLQNPDHQDFEAAWNTFFLDVTRVQALPGLLSAEDARSLITAGQRWSGSGWNTSKASKAIYALTGVPLVKAAWVDYRNAFLYALSLLLEVDVQELDLGDKVAEAAFTMLNVFTGEATGAVVSAQDYSAGYPGSSPGPGVPFYPPGAVTEESEEEVQLSWDQPKVPLPVELSYIWSGTTSGERKLDMKTILAAVPKFLELPVAAPLNNHRLDGTGRQDKKEREYQQKLLHAVRLLAYGYGQVAPEQAQAQVVLQQLFQLLVELYVRVENSRKENSIPGSIAPSGEVLFDKQELQTALQAQKINRAGKGFLQSPLASHSAAHLPVTGRSFGSYRPFGRGFGYGSHWWHQGGKGKGPKPFFARRPFGKGKGMAPRNAHGMVPGSSSSSNAQPLAMEAPPPSEPECFLQEPERQSGMVAGVCIPRSYKSDSKWGPPPLGLNGPLSCQVQRKSLADIQAAEKILAEYESVGAVRKLLPHESHHHLVPWFIIRKMEANKKEKLRLISDCRELNQYFQPGHFKLDHMQHIFPMLRKGMWAAKIDLKHAYFHVGLHPHLRKYMHLQVGTQVWEFQAACFGLNVLPQLFMKLMKTFQRLWRQQGILCYIYLDDILLLGSTAHQVTKHLQILLHDLHASGMQVNYEKSTLSPTQNVTHLGFTLDLKNGFLQVPSEKLKNVRKELGKLIVLDCMPVRKMAAILGQVRSFLTALPFLRAFTDQFVALLKKNWSHGWNFVAAIPAELKAQVRTLKDIFLHWSGRKFEGKIPIRKLAADSSDHAWAGLDLQTGHVLQEFWRSQTGLHINVKEILAAIHTVRSLAHPGEKVFLLVDNTTTFWYLKRQGGRKTTFNHLLRPFLIWCLQNDIHVEVQLVKSAEMPADKLSRPFLDRGDYTLNSALFQHMWSIFRDFLPVPVVDMFASPGNHKFPKFVSRHPHWQAIGVDALNMPLDGIQTCYSNPPWNIIQRWLLRLRQHPHLLCWMVAPFWVSSIWFPLLLKLIVPHTPIWVVQQFHGMFQNCIGQCMKAPRWPLLFCLLSGKYFRGNKCRFKFKTLYWQK